MRYLECETFTLIGRYPRVSNVLPAPSCRGRREGRNRGFLRNIGTYLPTAGSGSPVGIATDYGLDGPWIELEWGEIFRTRPGRSWAHAASCTMGTGSFLGLKRPGRGADHPTHSSAEVKKV
jgi:hypothetical protein